ncbi:hypothetical protein LSH36_5g00013 [Paralvinella palmiformis]|uniref:Hexosyltransferase n=1 Tax=Paralvinella palmiformis TaxID=53620 RepID=A0AAD9KF62_9ANNE|nr:hypothetical protein LSH36_5g00013 [Paralvinella palmiformis]
MAIIIKYRLLIVSTLIACVVLYSRLLNSHSWPVIFEQNSNVLPYTYLKAYSHSTLEMELNDQTKSPDRNRNTNENGDVVPYSGNATNNPLPQDVSFIISNPNICKNVSELKYIVYVHSAPHNYVRRNLLRTTWLNTTFFSRSIMKTVFLIGRSAKPEIEIKVKAEAEQYGDIVQGDFIDEYRNLTLKGIFGLKWVSTYCKEALLLIKVDDDAFVDIFKLVKMLKMYEETKRTIICGFYKENTMPILRNPLTCGKWCVKWDEFPGKAFFPRYCTGLAYIISVDLVPMLYNMSRSTPFFWIDDVYITGLLPRTIDNVQYVSIDEKYTLKESNAIGELKDVNKTLTYIFVHASYPDVFKSMWQLLLERTDNHTVH